MIRVLLVDDDPLLRSGLKLMLAPEPEIEVVAEAGDGDEVLAAVDRHRPDVVLMDIRMPRLDGIAATRLLSQQPQPPKVIVLTTFDADELVVRGLEAGALGFLLKDSSPARSSRRSRTSTPATARCRPRVARQLIALVAGDGEAGRKRDRARALLAELSPRERDVADAIGRGASNAEIAGELHISVGTVKSHTSQLLAKLGVENRVQVALLVTEAR